jgi:two-component system chemotaxis sensor kinase CheA
LILDVMGLAQQSGVIAQGRERARTESLAPVPRGAERQTLLLFGLGADRRLAIPLSRVSRLEEFPPSIVERAGDREVVQYRGEIMPLARLSALLGIAPGPEADPLQVVVSSGGGRPIGLVVDRIVDIVEETVRLQLGDDDRLLGSAVIQEHVTDLLDLERLLASTDRLAGVGS